MNLHSDQDVADLLGISVTEVRNNCRPSVRGWPCIKPKRDVWRFTDAQVEQIVAMSSPKPKVAALGGQTARSKRRAS